MSYRPILAHALRTTADVCDVGANKLREYAGRLDGDDSLWRARLEHSRQLHPHPHSATSCASRPCPTHHRSEHPLRDFPQRWDDDECLMTRVCTHGISHPDPDDPKASRYHDHPCDGCCTSH